MSRRRLNVVQSWIRIALTQKQAAYAETRLSELLIPRHQNPSRLEIVPAVVVDLDSATALHGNLIGDDLIANVASICVNVQGRAGKIKRAGNIQFSTARKLRGLDVVYILPEG